MRKPGTLSLRLPCNGPETSTWKSESVTDQPTNRLTVVGANVLKNYQYQVWNKFTMAMAVRIRMIFGVKPCNGLRKYGGCEAKVWEGNKTNRELHSFVVLPSPHCALHCVLPVYRTLCRCPGKVTCSHRPHSLFDDFVLLFSCISKSFPTYQNPTETRRCR